MPELDTRHSTVFMIGPTESVLTKRGNRHPSLASYLVDHGQSVTYLSSNFSHATKTFFSREEISRAADVCPYRLVIFRALGYSRNVSIRRVINNFLFSIRVFQWLLFRVSKNDVVILPSRPVELIYFVGLLRKLKKCQVLLDIQDVWPDALQIESKKKKWLFEKYCNFFLRHSLKRIDSFIHVAPSFVSWLNRYSSTAESHFVPLGYDAVRWGEPSPMRQKKLGKPIEIVCVGMLQHQIDILPVLKALVGRPDYRLTVIGDDGEGERYDEVVQFIGKHDLENVLLVGKVAPNEMPKHLLKMDVGVVPMITNSIPNKVFDYIAACLPILVLGENDSGWLVGEEGIGWVVPYDSSGVTSFLKDLNSDNYADRRAKLVECRDQFDRQYLFSTVLDLINSSPKESS